MRATDLDDQDSDEDCERRGPAAARRVGFTVAAILLFLSSSAALYVWSHAFLQSIKSSSMSGLNGRLVEILKATFGIAPSTIWLEIFLFAFLITALLPAALLSVAKRNSPTHFQSEHWIWATLLFWICGIWILELGGMNFLSYASWFPPWEFRSVDPHFISPATNWSALAVPAAVAAGFAAYRAHETRPPHPVFIIQRARAARLRLTAGVALLYVWLQCTVYASAALDIRSASLPNFHLRLANLGHPSRHNLISSFEKAEALKFQPMYLASNEYVRHYCCAGAFALIVFAALKVARNRQAQQPRDAWSALVTCAAFLTFVFTYRSGTLDTLAFASDTLAPHPSILSLGLTDPIPVATLPFCTLVAYVAWRDWKSATSRMLTQCPSRHPTP